MKVEFSQLAELRMFAISFLLASGKIDQEIQVSDVTIAQQLVLKHCAERRRDRHREFKRHKIVDEPLHHAQQRDVRFGDCLKQPLFLEEMLVLRMTNERKMSVKNQGEMTWHCGRFTPSFGAESRNPDAIRHVTPRGPSTTLCSLGMTA